MAAPGMASLGSSSQVVTEYVVRVPRSTTKRYNIMAFNAADKVNISTWHQARMERDLSSRRLYQEEELPESGAGSEFHRRIRDEARRRKLGITIKPFRAEEQPWLLRVNGKGGRRRNKVLNHFSIMQQRRLRDHGEEEEEEKERQAKKGGELRIHDLEDDLELSSDGSDGSDPDDEKPRPRSKPPQEQKKKQQQKKKKRRGSDDDEAFEDSDDGDFEGQEVDYTHVRSRSRSGTGPLPPVVRREVQLTEDAVRRYLARKPMTTKDLLKKFPARRTALSSEQTVNALAQILKRLNPERKVIGDKMHFFLKE
ncbi:general transcription factor IIF subunit 1 [Coturnix japonica]|uniref:general transcription factor IIF subunit 1 n=1 Tax=Coturnix japonica TaxID=93934 RepID=UPI0013A5EFC3|nr:general transcription factor IIF subunit 1 [Coturnix japonica]